MKVSRIPWVWDRSYVPHAQDEGRQKQTAWALYLLSRRGLPEDAMGEWFPVFMFQEWCPLNSAPLVQSPQEQDSKLQEANNMCKERILTASVAGGEH